MPYPSEHSARLRNPGDFKELPDWSTKGKFRRTKGGKIFGRVTVPKTISIIWGQLKSQSGHTAAVQSLRFPIRYWTTATAKAWLKKNRIKFIRFEPAGPRKTTSAATYLCECIDCGFQVETSRHCRDVPCPECGGQMRRAERPGPGQPTR